MKQKSLLIYGLCAMALGGWLMLPGQLRGQAEGENAEVTALVAEISAQQATLVANQAKMDAVIATIAEDLRLARIFAARGGGRGGK